MTNATVDARGNDLADGFKPALVSGDTRHQTLASPASVAVHDYGNVRRHLRYIGDITRRAKNAADGHCVETPLVVAASSDLHQVFFFFGEKLVYFRDVTIGQFLNVLFRATFLIF
ncbi:hypothetical protein GCM10025771_32850 [Niveibacterium umoris]